MAFGIFLNFEKVSIQIIEEHISKMTNNNIFYDEQTNYAMLNEDYFINNLVNGSTAIIFIQNLFETAINTILKR